MTRLLFGILSCLLLPLVHAQVLSPKSPALGPLQEAVTIEERSTLVVAESDGATQETVHERVRIQNDAGLKQYGIITFGFTTTSDFKIDRVEVHKKDGTVVKAGMENIQEATPEISRIAPVYSDLRQKHVTVPGLAVGDVVEFQYTSRENSLIPGQFWFQHSFRKDAVVLSETVQLNVPKDRKLHIKSQPGYAPVIREEGDRRIYSWQTSNEKAPGEKEQKAILKLAAFGNASVPSIEVSTIDSWDNVGSWYNRLQKDRLALGAALKAKALEVTSGLTSADEKLKALYVFVSLNIRYIGVDFGIGRYQPHAADLVLSNGYGDCKDKHTLFAAMLQSIGIEAYPALINSRHNIDLEVPSPAQFDHVITAIPKGHDFVFLDTTAEVAPYGMLLQTLRHKPALVIPANGAGRFVETPADLPFPARETFELHGKVDESGTMEAEVSHFIQGDPEVAFKNAFRQNPPSKYKDIVQGMSYFWGFAGDVSDVKLAGTQDTRPGFHWDYHYHRPGYFDMEDQRPKNSLPLRGLYLPKMEETDDSLRLYTSTGELDFKCTVKLPEGFTAQAPLSIKLERDYASYESTYSVDKNVVTAEKKIIIRIPQVPAAQRQDYEAFRRAINQDEAQTIALQLPSGFVPKLSSASNTDLDELMRQGEIEMRQRDYLAALATFRKVAGRDPKHKGVWMQLGLADLALGHKDEALQDLQKELERDPFDAGTHAQLGVIYETMGRKNEAVSEWKKAAEISPLLHGPHYFLGRYFSREKDYAQAVPELEKAMATSNPAFRDEDQVQGLLSQAYFKMKQPEKAADLLNRSVEAAPNPQTWNNVAYALADNDFQLEKAKQYAELAIKALGEQLKDLNENSITRSDFEKITTLVYTWDTLGWIYFKLGDASTAEKYVRAAWLMDQTPTVGEHLGEIYEKLGRTQDAMRFYAMSGRPVLPFNTAAALPRDVARERLEKLAGKARANTLITTYAGESSKERTVNIGKAGEPGARAELLLVFSPGPKLDAVQIVNGDRQFKDAVLRSAPAILKLVAFPDDRPIKLARQAFVECSKYAPGCNLVVNIGPTF
jgi:tetratricopeptide (TPR) repeat protein